MYNVLGYILNECEILSDKDITSYNDNTEKEELTHEFIDYVSDFNHIEEESEYANKSDSNKRNGGLFIKF